MKEKIGFFDIDGVVAETGKAMIELVKNEFKKTWVTIEDINQYDITKLSWLNPNEIEFLLEKFAQPDFYIHISPVNEAPYITRILKNTGWKIIFITARPSYLYDLTLFWLKKNHFHFDELIITNAHEKIKYCINSDKCFFVEDRPDIIERIAIEMPKMTIFVYDQPWNRSVNIGKRIKRLTDILKTMENKS